MKKTLIALSIFAFVGGTSIASFALATNSPVSMEMTDGGKDKKKKKCSDDCAKECCTKDAKATKGCSKDASKSCCSKKKAAEKK